jgi:hypothetical protein
MNQDYNTQLDAAVDRVLKRLPDRQAPDSLAPRVMRALQAQLEPASLRRSWQNWPAPLRWSAFAALLAFFGALCFGSWRLAQTEAVALALHRIEVCLAPIGTFYHALKAVLGAFFLAGRELGPGFLLGCGCAAALAYGCCLALGAVYLRLALSRHQY